ncbi:MAG: 3-phosphoglycerate dehydrogenase, partial [Bacteroidota bacterium]
MKILANDGIDQAGQDMLEKAGHQVVTTKVPQDQLHHELPEFDGIVVRSATKVRSDLIDACPNLRFIARAGVGMDNIDVDYARSKGIPVINTPAASSIAVAELVFAHMLSLCRFLHQAHRDMPHRG